MRKRLAATILILTILSGATYAEDVIFPKPVTSQTFVHYLKATWSYVLHLVR